MAMRTEVVGNVYFFRASSGLYLCVLESKARAQHCKTWGGMGQPEVKRFFESCDCGENMFGSRGTLEVAFWRELPKFNMKWNPKKEGEQGQWEAR
jgi:hypothetical protein